MTTPTLGIVGWSGSGKTTLLEALLPLLKAQGLNVNVVKHSHKVPEMEPPHKDSARLRVAGASEVLLSSPYRYVITHEVKDEEPSLFALLSRLSPSDLILIEGYKWEPIPKLEVFRPSTGKQPQYTEDAHIIAVASDIPAPESLPRPLDWLNLNRPEMVLAWLLAYVRQSAQ